MSQKIKIYGIEGFIPDVPNKKDIEGFNKPIKEQYFVRADLPEFFQPENVRFDDEGDPRYSPEQRKYADRELDRCEFGHWIMIKGNPVYINKFYYYWLTYWTLEDGFRPEYRECDRRFFLFMEFCMANPFIAAVIRGKARREGASSHGTCIETHIATFGSNRRIGNVSKTGNDVEDLFENMIVPAFKALPIFLRPRTDNPDDPKAKTGFNFKRPSSKKKIKGVADTSRKGLNSIITTRDTTLNAYDSGRWSFVLVDEGGKWLKVNINKYWSILKQTLVKGAARVGFAYLPSTVNPPKEGGNNFKMLYDLADQFKYPLNKLPKQMVKFFKPAYDGLAGFIDMYGDSVIEPPDTETLNFLIYKNTLVDESERIPEEYLKLGAKQYLAERLALLEDEDDISEEKRMYPTKEADMFDFGESMSPFNVDKLKAQEKWLKDNPYPLRRGKFVWNPLKQKVEWYDDPKGLWEVSVLLDDGMSNRWTKEGRNIIRPGNGHNFGGGVDTFRFDKTVELGSKGSIWVGSKLDATKDDGEDGGEPVAKYLGRPKLTEYFWKEILLAGLYYGCTLTVEKDATQEFIKYFNNTMPNFLEANCLPMLGKKPDVVIDKTRSSDYLKKDSGYGASSADPFVFAKQIEICVIYIEKYCHKIKHPSILAELQIFDPSNRTSFDESIAFMMMLLNICGDFQQRKKETKKVKKFVQYYTIH